MRVASAAGLSPEVAAALALGTAMLMTGCLHEDGLSDVADGFGGGRTREQKLEIMRDSRIGAYGASALLMSALIRWSALTQLGNPFWVFSGLVAAHAASRALLPVFMHLVPPARQDGLAAGAGQVSSDTAVAASRSARWRCWRLGCRDWWPQPSFSPSSSIGFRRLCLREIGGQTGDTLGALQQLGEIAVLIVAAAVLT